MQKSLPPHLPSKELLKRAGSRHASGKNRAVTNFQSLVGTRELGTRIRFNVRGANVGADLGVCPFLLVPRLQPGNEREHRHFRVGTKNVIAVNWEIEYKKACESGN